jgi:hypothetical protein
LDEIEAEVVSLPITTVAAVSGDTEAALDPLSIRPVPIATVMAVSGSSDATLHQISTRPIPIATVAAVSGIPLPFRSLASWTPVLLHNGQWLTWHTSYEVRLP